MNLSESYRKRMQELAGIETNSEDILSGLKKHAKFFDNYEDFENFYSIKGNHGIYYHITNTPNFQISQQTGPRDMSSMSSGSISEKGALMVTSDLEYWDEYYNSYDPDTPENEDVKRNYVAIIDLSEIKPSKLNPTQRGFGHEIYLKPDDTKKAKIIKVLNIQDARKFNDNFNKIKPNNSKELKKLWLLVHQQLNENSNVDKEFIFHGTNNAAAYHIQRYGGMKLNAANNNEPYISFTSDMKVAQYYATMKGGSSNGVVLRIKRTPDFFLSPKYKKNKGHEWVTTREIPLQELEIKTSNGWVPLENWDIIDKKIMTLSENNLPDMQSMLSKYKLRYPKDNVLIIVNINKLLARHKHDEPDYAFDSKETSNYPGRVDRAKEYWTNYANDPRPISPKDGTRNDWGDMTFEAPYVSIYNGKLGFSDGRHRVIAMKELGYDDIVIEVPKDQIHQFMELK